MKLLFQRLLTAGQATPTKLQDVLSYELTTAPSSLFDTCGMMRTCQKSLLAKSLWSADTAATREEMLSPSLHHVLDGGSLLHKISWPRGTTYKQIADLYVRYVQTQYASTTVVFDGYALSTTTKDSAHTRRGLRSSSDVEISPDAFLGEMKDAFCQKTTISKISLTFLAPS
ncbi:hypothetical protein ElyMa_000790100 [Elysia marginata]|uniref:Uncharacterized protein n=1 Tax=Elysia marginata TaxID=1093978 RepID=A0AAV4GUR8_9GAST|nr:hypothetical protein ElyMa_000790100 [Elysia marginata]